MNPTTRDGGRERAPAYEGKVHRLLEQFYDDVLMRCPKCGYVGTRERSTVTYFCPPCSRSGQGPTALEEVPQ